MHVNSRTPLGGLIEGSRALVLALLICGSLTGVAQAAQRVRLSADFLPNRPGKSTTISFDFSISTTDGRTPSPVRGVNLRLPRGMGLATTTLGLAECETSTLLKVGLEGCSTNARIGYGGALVSVPLGSDSALEKVGVSAVLGPVDDGRLTVLFFANALAPVSAQIVFPAQVLPDSDASSGGLDTLVPRVPVLPDGPDASVVRFHSTLGPRHLTYYRRRHGRREPFHPRGATVPKACPRAGYPFAGSFVFEDGSRVGAATRIPCATTKH